MRNMHTRNGLLDRVRSSEFSLKTVEKDAIALLLQHCEPFEGVLAGNSIHTDRTFIAHHMPAFDKLLHYRMIDVTSVKMITKAWYPNAPGRSKIEAAHTVLSDLEASIAELSFYQQQFFKRPNEL